MIDGGTLQDNLEDQFDGTGYVGGTIASQADMTAIHGTALTETATQLAGRFTDFFDAATAGFTVANALADFKATGFSTLVASDNIGINWADVSNQGTAVDLSATAISLVDTASTVTDADGIWDALSKDHNTKGTMGELLKKARGGTPVELSQGTAQAGTINTITLAAAEIYRDNEIRNNLIQITEGTGLGQSNVVASFVGTTKVATMTGN